MTCVKWGSLQILLVASANVAIPSRMHDFACNLLMSFFMPHSFTVYSSLSFINWSFSSCINFILFIASSETWISSTKFWFTSCKSSFSIVLSLTNWSLIGFRYSFCLLSCSISWYSLLYFNCIILPHVSSSIAFLLLRFATFSLSCSVRTYSLHSACLFVILPTSALGSFDELSSSMLLEL